MAERLKDMFFTRDSMGIFADNILEVYPVFDKPRFLDFVFDETFFDKELKERMSHTTLCLKEILPEPFPEALEILLKAAPKVRGFEAMSIPDYVSVYGMEYWDISLPAIGRITRYITCEFAIRPFLDKDPGKVLPYLLEWAENESHHVRRLASEGSRPRLPWAMALPKFKKDPHPILPILEKLKEDESETVRRSVANNLNDISKDNPGIALKVCREWYGHSEETDKIVKHACRTMLKAGHKDALMIFGYGDPSSISIENFHLEESSINIGDDLRFSFDVVFEKKCKARLEYGVSYVKSNGKLSSKVFKITEGSYKPGTYSFKRKQSFADMSTRKHYPGKHQISLLLNGEEKAQTSFELK
ncbi:DNA alkylation repair protein [Acidobacteriota bacterium]